MEDFIKVDFVLLLEIFMHDASDTESKIRYNFMPTKKLTRIRYNY